jgi:hypothetical protein
VEFSALKGRVLTSERRFVGVEGPARSVGFPELVEGENDGWKLK